MIDLQPLILIDWMTGTGLERAYRHSLPNDQAKLELREACKPSKQQSNGPSFRGI